MSPILVTILLLAGAPTPAPSKVVEVVVFPDRAQVTRSLEAACGARAQVAFSGITPAADPASFRARTSVGTVEGLRAEERTRAEVFSGPVKEIDAAIRKLEMERRALTDAQERAGRAVRAATSYGEVALDAIGREMSEPAPNVKAWGAAFDTTLQTRQRASSDELEARVKIRDLDRKIEDQWRKRERMTISGARREYLAEVLIACPPGQTAKVDLTYLVGGAAWEASYEARADEAGSAIELGTYATVRQSTGEDWVKARVILSTAVPRQDATPPEVQPLRVWGEKESKHKKVLVRRDEVREHAEAPGGSESQGMTPTPDKSRMAVASQGLSVQLQVPDPADIPGDGTPARLFVAKNKLTARFALKTTPKLAPFAFRVADLTNGAPFPLLPGPLDAFRKGGLIARYWIERVPEGGRFQLTFGIEESVRVKRVVVEEVQRDKGFFGSTRRFRFAYRFEIANYLGRAEEVEVAEHYPVSELEDVKVQLDDRCTPGYQVRGDDGIVTWKVKLKAGEKRNVELMFHVDVPSSYDSGNL